MKQKMTEYELSVLLARQIFGLDDLYFGIWDQDHAPNLTDLPRAQQRFIELLSAMLPTAGENDINVLHVGCGTGAIVTALTKLGYNVDGCTQYKSLYKLARENISQAGCNAKLFNLQFNLFPAADYEQHYDVVVLSDSLSTLTINKTLQSLEQIIKPGGICIIFDFFNSTHEDDNNSLDVHNISSLQSNIKQSSFSLIQQQDLSHYILPNLKLMQEFLVRHIKPAIHTMSQYAIEHFPLTVNTVGKIITRHWHKNTDKYFSGEQYNQMQNDALRYYLLMLQRVKPI